MRACSMDLRVRAVRDLDAGMLPDAVAEKYHVSGSWVRLLRQRRRETGEIAPRPQRYGPQRKLEPHLHTLVDLQIEDIEVLAPSYSELVETSPGLDSIWKTWPPGARIRKLPAFAPGRRITFWVVVCWGENMSRGRLWVAAWCGW